MIDITNYDEVKDKIYPRLINKTNLNDKLSKCWYNEYLDLYLMYHIRLDETKSAILCESMLKFWNIDFDKVRIQAEKNVASQVLMLKMEEALRKLTDKDVSIPEDVEMYIITTEYQTYGAGAILANKEWYEDDLLLLPSSVNEWIALPWDYYINTGYSMLCDMIQNINREIVHPQEVLSDHPYIWNHRTHILQQL